VQVAVKLLLLRRFKMTQIYNPLTSTDVIEGVLTEEKCVFWDDFIGNTMQTNWTADNGGGAAAVSFQIEATTEDTNGSIDGETGTANDANAWTRVRLGASTKQPFEPSLNCGIEFRLKIAPTISASHCQIGLYKDADEYAIFENDNGDSNFDYKADGGSGTPVDTAGAAVGDDTWAVFRIECTNTGVVRFYIDGDLKLTTAIDVVNDAAGGQKMKPYFRFWADDATNRHMYIDYVKVWQDRT